MYLGYNNEFNATFQYSLLYSLHTLLYYDKLNSVITVEVASGWNIHLMKKKIPKRVGSNLMVVKTLFWSMQSWWIPWNQRNQDCLVACQTVGILLRLPKGISYLGNVSTNIYCVYFFTQANKHSSCGNVGHDQLELNLNWWPKG